MALAAHMVEKLPLRLQPYARLMRLHQPTGLWLLFWPACWGLLLGAEQATTLSPHAIHPTGWCATGASLVMTGRELLGWLGVFWLGSLLMRSAGCIVNDMVDRRFDADVERTRNRPLACGELTLRQAYGALGLLLLAAFGLWWLLPWEAKGLCLLVLPLVGLYPFMKRWTWWPQVFLGVAFNAAFIGYATVVPAWLWEWQGAALYAASFLWILGFDTLYAHQDKWDDARIGVKSTALRLGAATRPFVLLCYGGMVGLLGYVVWPYGVSVGIVLGMGGIMVWQVWRVDLDRPQQAGQAFHVNRWLGAWVALAFGWPLLLGAL